MYILIVGASGFIGRHLTQYLRSVGHTVSPLLREKGVWEPAEGVLDVSALTGFDAIINLAGEPITNGRWSAEKKKKIISSRVDATRLLAREIQQLKVPPRLFLCASATGYYGSRGDEELTEESSAGTGFLAEVCQKWEAAAQMAARTGVRVIRLRTGAVIGQDGGVLAKMRPIFQWGLGGKIGDGQQWMSWIAMEDLVRLVQFLLSHEEIKGAVNAVAPQPIRNKEFTRLLASALHRPAFCTVPAWALRCLLGEMADEVLLSSVRAYPAKALALGFEFYTSNFLQRGVYGN